MECVCLTPQRPFLYVIGVYVCEMLVDGMCVFIHDQRTIPAGASACVRNTLTPQRPFLYVIGVYVCVMLVDGMCVFNPSRTIPICDMCVCVCDAGRWNVQFSMVQRAKPTGASSCDRKTQAALVNG